MFFAHTAGCMDRDEYHLCIEFTSAFCAANTFPPFEFLA